MLRVEWTSPALDQFGQAQDYYFSVEPRAAALIAMRIVESIQRLREQPKLGRPGRIPGDRCPS